MSLLLKKHGSKLPYFSKGGVTLISLFVELFITAIAVGIISSTIAPFLKIVKSFTSKVEDNLSLIKAAQHIKRVGSLANSCSKDLPNLALQCLSDPQGTGITRKVRFIVNNNALQYQEERAPNNWVSRFSYVNVTELTLCDNDDMAANTCPLQPIALSQRHAENNDAFRDSRFLRFRLSGLESSGVSRKPQIQTAFYIRNGSAVEPRYLTSGGY